ncbi:MAG: hypothetical protein HOQ05_12160 [Corynebacteriales bacterium]|nr:hypothetical protein [Mycobacteriales bacterium]
MRNIYRVIAVGALAIPFALGAAGVAAADDDVKFKDKHSHSGPYGAELCKVKSYAEEYGDTYFYEFCLKANKHGAWANSTEASTD